MQFQFSFMLLICMYLDVFKCPFFALPIFYVANSSYKLQRFKLKAYKRGKWQSSWSPVHWSWSRSTLQHSSPTAFFPSVFLESIFQDLSSQMQFLCLNFLNMLAQSVNFLSKTQCNKFWRFWKVNSFTKFFQIFIIHLTLHQIFSKLTEFLEYNYK